MCHIYLVQICADLVSQQLDILLAFISVGCRERAGQGGKCMGSQCTALPEGCCLGHILENLAVLLTSLIHWHCVCHILLDTVAGCEVLQGSGNIEQCKQACCTGELSFYKLLKLI